MSEVPTNPADALRRAADWLHTYDGMAQSYFDLLERVGLATSDELASLRANTAKTEVQDDLREIADRIEQLANWSATSPPYAAKDARPEG